MAQPTWITAKGSIGSYVEGTPVTFTFQATPSSMANTLVYSKLNGAFPDSSSTLTTFALNSTTGVLTGTAAQVESDTTHSFTIRVLEYSGSTLISFNDRTFSIAVTGTTAPTFITPAGALYPSPNYLAACTWDPFQIVVDNPDPNTTAIIRLVYGTLPPGLEINSDGLIRGYATQPASSTITYSFTLEVISESGSALEDFSITVKQNVTPAPVIMNTQPPSYTIPVTDPNFPYYVSSTGDIGTLYQDNFFIFKILGHDFDSNPLTYSYTGTLPPGVTMNLTTGWITGTLTASSSIVDAYSFSVTAYNGTDYSDPVPFSMMVVQQVNDAPIDIAVNWLTDSDLGIINNGAISSLAVEASNPSGLLLEYAIISGTLPPNLQLLTTGEIIGRLAFESDSTSIPLGTSTPYSVTIEAANPLYPEISSTREFTITAYQKFSSLTDPPPPYEDIYIKALISPSDRSTLDTLLSNTTLIPTEYVYRPTDPYFGKADSVIYQHMFGVPSSTVDDYIAAVIYNHYWRNITLGPLRTAVATDQSGNIIYELVYSEIIDNLTKKVNGDTISVNKEITWPRPINGSTDPLYPNSLPNMRQQIADAMPPVNTDNSILPLWMTCQQSNGSSLGFTPAWVICYTLPGKAETILRNIETLFSTSITATQTILESVSIVCESTENFYINMPLIFSGTTFGGITASTTYYVQSVLSPTQFSITDQLDGDVLMVTNAIGTMAITPQCGWGTTLNMFNFILDRFEVDKSLTYNYNPTTEIWASYPSDGVTNDTEDVYIYYPQKTILS
jgi:hypothetical protein